MKTMIAAVALSFVAGAAFAGEGQGNPFPFTAPPYNVLMQGWNRAAGPGQTTALSTDRVLPTNGSAGVVQSVNSLPPGFEDGAVGQADVTRSAPMATRVAQPATPSSGRRG